MVGESAPELDGELAGPEALQALLLELAQARRTATLWVEHPGLNVLSRVTFAVGVVVDARGSDTRGRDALRELLLLPGATYYMVRGEVELVEQPLSLEVSDAIAEVRRSSRHAA